LDVVPRMQNIFSVSCLLTPVNLFIMLLFDFSDPETTGLFRPIGDQVMGGVSIGRMEQGNGFAVFTGAVSFEHSGGFASVRSFPDKYDLSASKGVELEAKGDGKTYKFSVALDLRFDSPVYRARFTPSVEDWSVTKIPFDKFEPTFRGDVLSDAPPLDPARIATFGFLISDRQEGDFRLEVRRVTAYE
jgi:NADH dehydrogenase [ubiquinone] 1 alpha subcomplex assembly factor 1